MNNLQGKKRPMNESFREVVSFMNPEGMIPENYDLDLAPSHYLECTRPFLRIRDLPFQVQGKGQNACPGNN